MTSLPLPTINFEIPNSAYAAMRLRMRREWNWIAHHAKQYRMARASRRIRLAAAKHERDTERARLDLFIRGCAMDGRISYTEAN